ncbi:MAG TPA: carboxylating nicotinate-nucleotide diphosphorylase [Candidatus Polarisedimenticolia bacterium]|nr:carboxylating nicotinate-nucleotide diphosphorylase [Candidatus Polarisedimenticolia bacterium]
MVSPVSQGVDRRTCTRLVKRALREDIGAGDLTTRRVVAARARGVGTIVAKGPLVLCGLSLAREVFHRLDPALRFEALRAEGSLVRAGTPVARVEGRAASILSGERTALNFLQHLSGISTLTRRCVERARGRCRIRDTRKTHPGLRDLEKYAVRVGGGENHRFRLDDGILIKHNHWRVSGGVGEAVRRARRAGGVGRARAIQVEVSTLGDLREAIDAGADGVLLDNLSPRQIHRALAVARGRVHVEVSGGITENTVARFAAFHPDALSLGALTHSAPWVDLALRLEGRER